MEKKKLLENLAAFCNAHKLEYGIERLGVFGSYARNDADSESDVDVVVHLSKQDLFNIIGIKQDLEWYLKLPVDVVSYRANMDSFLKKRIDRETIYV
jgi:hypothetical protein